MDPLPNLLDLCNCCGQFWLQFPSLPVVTLKAKGILSSALKLRDYRTFAYSFVLFFWLPSQNPTKPPTLAGPCLRTPVAGADLERAEA